MVIPATTLTATAITAILSKPVQQRLPMLWTRCKIDPTWTAVH
jgi:hypothetical protein